MLNHIQSQEKMNVFLKQIVYALLGTLHDHYSLQATAKLKLLRMVLTKLVKHCFILIFNQMSNNILCNQIV